MDRTLQFDLEWSDHIASNSRLCIFVGSGVSSGCRTDEGASPPNWADLIDELAVAYGCADLLQGGKLELQERAELVDRHRRSLGVTNMDFSSEIAKLVDCVNGRLVRESVVHSTIADIDPPLIVTTNYDRILERYLNGSTEPGYNVWTYPGRVEQLSPNTSCSQSDSLGDFLRSSDPLIMKIHGGVPLTDGELEEMRDLERYSDEDYSVVLSYGSYRKAYSENGELPALLRSIFSTHQVIFIGYSLRDTVLRDVMQSVGALRGKKFPHVILQSPESVVPGEYREAFEEFYGVKVGTYSNHSRLAASLHSLMLSRA